MKKLHYILFMLFLMILVKAGQSQSIGIDTAAFNLGSLPDSIMINDNYNHTIRVQNKSATPFTGTIWLMAAVDTGTGIIDIDTVGFSNVVNFGLGDTSSISYNEIYNFANSYKLGGNIVVVWPAINIGNAADSLFKNVWIFMANEILPVAFENQGLFPYPNPFRDKLNLHDLREKSILNMRLMNSSGQLMWSGPFSEELYLGTLPEGIYLLQLITEDRKIFHYKLLKE
ncbi:MAG: T9SS type A sorting domain-containing protein [Flavobacteriales bacterium]|nr:T9SS type A sorting domain-containing protein [Flavobacteriales bacterium]